LEHEVLDNPRIMDSGVAALIGAGIGASVSALTILGNMYSVRQTLRHGAAKDIAKVSIEHKIQQLNELYGPLLQLTEQNDRLARKLREGKTDPKAWRLLDHLPAVLRDPNDGPIAKEILGIDAQIEQLIINKGGLVRGAPPESFQKFLSHYRLLKLAMEGNTVAGQTEYYPRALDDDVRTAYNELKSGIDRVLERYESILSKFLD